MSEFFINTESVISCGEHIVEIADSFSNVISTLNDAKLGLSACSIFVNGAIDYAAISLNRHKAKLKEIGILAVYAAKMYQNANNNLISDNSQSCENISTDASSENDSNQNNNQREMSLRELLQLLYEREIITNMGLLTLFWDLFSAGFSLRWNLLSNADAIIEGLINGELDEELVEELRQWMLAYIPNHVNDTSLLFVYWLASLINTQSPADIMQHYLDNQAAWQARGDVDYIDNQSDFADIVYGNYNVGSSGCGLVATYNVLYYLNGGGSNYPLPDIARAFEISGIALDGRIGTSIMSIEQYFGVNGYETNMLYGDNLTTPNLNQMEKDYKAYLMLVYNNENDITAGMHYVSIIPNESGGYTVYNGSGQRNFDTLEEAVNGYNGGNAETVAVVGVR